MQTPPPGWYPDPENSSKSRYWDGTTWTVNVYAPGNGQANPPSLRLTKTGILLGAVAILVLASASLIPTDAILQFRQTGSSPVPEIPFRAFPLMLAFWLAIAGLLTSSFGYRRFREVEPRPRTTSIAILLNAAAIVLSIALPIT